MNKSCACCKDGKPGLSRGREGYGYNYLVGKQLEWTKENGFPRSEYCVPVKGGRRFGGPRWIKNKCGNGRLGFSTRRRRQDEVRMDYGLDGQLKSGRKTIVCRKSARSVVSRRAKRVDGSRVCLVASFHRDPIITAQRERDQKKFKRAANRNNRARHGHMRK